MSSSDAVRQRKPAKYKQCNKCARWFVGTGHSKHQSACDGTVKEGKGLTETEVAALSQQASTATSEAEDEAGDPDSATSPAKPAQPKGKQQRRERASLPKVLLVVAPLSRGAAPDNHLIELP